MLTVVKNQIKVTSLAIKYALMREMTNKATFLSNIIFMILNNSVMIFQWLILYNINGQIGGYTLKNILLLWAIFAGWYGVSHFIFKNAFHLSDIINSGQLDTVLVQPKNVLISIITNSIETSAIGDIIYAYILFFIYGFSIKDFLLFTLFIITGGLIIVSIMVILGSLSFWKGKSDVFVDTFNSIVGLVATYPEGIFNGLVKILLYTIVPLGFVSYMPVNLMTSFSPLILGGILLYTAIMIALAFLIFNLGLKRYSSTNLMNARM